MIVPDEIGRFHWKSLQSNYMGPEYFWAEAKRNLTLGYIGVKFFNVYTTFQVSKFDTVKTNKLWHTYRMIMF